MHRTIFPFDVRVKDLRNTLDARTDPSSLGWYTEGSFTMMLGRVRIFQVISTVPGDARATSHISSSSLSSSKGDVITFITGREGETGINIYSW